MNQSTDSHTGYTYKYPHPAVTADCCVFAFLNNELSVLLIRRGIDPFKGHWALPGGFMRIDESAEQCAMRELREETDYSTDSLRQFHTYSGVGRDPRERVVTIAFYALVKMGAVRGGDDAEEARWFPVSQLPELAFDHALILHDALLAMRRDVYFEPIGFELLPPTFSMAELQKIIETLTGETYDRRNFYNKMRHMQFVTEVGDAYEDSDESLSRYNDAALMPGSTATMAEEDRWDERLSRFNYDRTDFGSGSGAPAPKAMANMNFMAEDGAKERKTSKRVRRSGVRYSFNPLAFKFRKDKKGNGPITY